MGYAWNLRLHGENDVSNGFGSTVTFESNGETMIITRGAVSYTLDILDGEIQRHREIAKMSGMAWRADGEPEGLKPGETIRQALNRLADSLCAEVPHV